MKKAIILSALMVLNSIAKSQQVAINTDGSAATDPKAMLEIKKATYSKLKVRSLSYNDTAELQLSNRTVGNAGTDFNFRSIREEGLFLSTSSDLAVNNSDSIMTVTPRGNIGIGGLPRNSAALEIKSTTKGLLTPRMTTVQRKAIVSPDLGLLVFDLDKKTLFLYDGYQWMPLAFVDQNALAPTPRFANDAEANDRFGASVAISGDYAIAGATVDNSVYIFYRNGNNWQQQAKLTTSDGEFIGLSVCISGDYAIAGAYNADIGVNARQGAAYIFARSGTTWTQQAKIFASDGIYDGGFGRSVSISGDYAIVGCGQQENAYVFVRSGTTWTQQAKLISTDHTLGDSFGASAAISGSYAIVGAPDQDVTATNQGAAYIFIRSGTTWTQQARLLQGSPASNDQFGSTVALSGDYAMVGAPRVDVLFTDEGFITMFARTGTAWNYNGNLYNPDAANFFYFGEGIGYLALTSSYALVTCQSKAYMYKKIGTNWTFIRRVTDLDETGFGGVSISGFNIILGASGNSTYGQGAGSISFLNIEP